MSRANSLVLQAYQYEQLEQSMCTGDIVLYNDSESRWPEWLSRLYALLPCSTYVVACMGTHESLDEEQAVEQVPQRDWLHWRCAALVVRMIDETETNPSRDPTRLIPYVFVVDGDNDCHGLYPLKTLLARIASKSSRGSRVYFAVRQLMTRSDTQQRHQRLVSQLRHHLRVQILTYYADVQTQEKEELQQIDRETLAKRHTLVSEALDDQKPRVPLDASPGAANKHKLALYRGSPCYFTLCALYQINVLRIEPQADTAIAAVQEGGILQTQLASDYSLTDEIPFFITVRG